MTDTRPTDQQLVNRVLLGDPDGMAELIARYGAALRSVLLHAGARVDDLDDLLQETWIRVIRSAARYDPLQPFSGWLFTIAMNRFRTRGAKWSEEARRREPLDDVASVAQSRGASAHAELEATERAEKVRELIATLPPKLADAVLLRYFEELSEKEVATALGVPVGTVKSRLHNAMSRLRSTLERRPS